MKPILRCFSIGFCRAKPIHLDSVFKKVSSFDYPALPAREVVHRRQRRLQARIELFMVASAGRVHSTLGAETRFSA